MVHFKMLYTSNTNKKRYLFKHVAGTGTVGTNRRLHLMFVVNFRGNRYRVPIFFCLKFSILLKRNFLSTAGVRRMQKPVINSFFLAGCWPRTQMKINRRAGLSTTCGLEKHVRKQEIPAVPGFQVFRFPVYPYLRPGVYSTAKCCSS
jgi:hypothetical protein